MAPNTSRSSTRACWPPVPGRALPHQVHRTARTAFGEAQRRGHITRNPVALAKAPRVEEDEVDPFEIAEIRQLITAALNRRNGVRFVLALAIGTRQGETIGLKWVRYSPETRLLRIARQLQRQTWQHGCSDPHARGQRYHKVKPCPSGCKRHARVCPPPCADDCTSHARWCPRRRGGGLVDVDVKSRAGRRGIVLPAQLAGLLEEHRAAQARERDVAGSVWEDDGWMFAQPNGRPIDQTMDRKEWKRLLADAGVRSARLHDARHTAATVLLLLAVPERAAMEVMGWSHSSMAKRYQHVTAVLRQDIAARLDGSSGPTAECWCRQLRPERSSTRVRRLCPTAAVFRSSLPIQGGASGAAWPCVRCSRKRPRGACGLRAGPREARGCVEVAALSG